MVATNSYPISNGAVAEPWRVRSAKEGHMEVTDTNQAPWYKGILKDDHTVAQDYTVQVVDNGNFIEFVLPQGTAQFAEMFVHDLTGNMVWKTQSFNERSILWHKQTLFGGRVPGGRYTFRMKQSNRQVYGSVEIPK